ncbi:sugar phosphate isomerase/epimerase family protein [Tropicibacter naphthalenivorans]|uniref:Hydroxypyruvate isomerase n=1 Tax=Tropicibacter naphthalenivorans TaxID=441103 RepID=A0A0P1G783_9RHOB|nr:sugar phosphate isomerase/epimerase [Tropicibacter naphthalenivorans]CUH77526.1 Hydroxypyruvate isomerase [Tropicibacter naphthalenivorans]SMC56543.1 Sugar phosphate isomerase/epimerase [Tropicibacter naphthalenivorans]
MDVSFQLYSAREATPWEDVIAKLAALGYTQVEGFGGVYTDPAAFRALLDQHGLTMPSGHFFPIGNFEETLDQTLATAKILGMNRIFCPAPEDLWRDGTDAANWIALAKRLHEAGKKVNDAGFAFGWHNHHWEFMPLPGGEIAMDLILEHAPNIDWEMDVAWVVRGGADPLKWIKAHADRITTAHVKDIAAQGECADEDGWADVGHGTMDWKAIMTALREVGVDLFVAEHDKPSDCDRFARRSIETIKGL